MKAHLTLPKGWKRLPRHERIKVGDRPMYTDGSVSKTRVPKGAAEVGMTVASSGWFNVARKARHAMKTPPPESLHLAATWIESNDGDESAELKTVSVWLRELASEKELEKHIRELAAYNGIKPSELTAATMRKIKAKLVEKFGQPANT